MVATNNDSAYATAPPNSRRPGAEVSLLDSRPEIHEARAHRMARRGRCHLRNRVSHPLEAVGAKGVHGLKLAAADGMAAGTAGTIESCDLLLVSGGWSPVVNLLSHRGVKPAWNAELACFLPSPCEEPVVMAGAAAGVWEMAACARSGQAAVAKRRLAKRHRRSTSGPVAGARRSARSTKFAWPEKKPKKASSIRSMTSPATMCASPTRKASSRSSI